MTVHKGLITLSSMKSADNSKNPFRYHFSSAHIDKHNKDNPACSYRKVNSITICPHCRHWIFVVNLVQSYSSGLKILTGREGEEFKVLQETIVTTYQSS